MFRFLAWLVGIVVGASVIAGVAGAAAALSYKRKAPPLPDPAADEIELVAVMDSERFASTAPAFRGGRVICWYAGLDLDLREAELDPAGARLEVRTVFGGTRVVVAPGVPVRLTGPAVFGGAMTPGDAPEPTADTPGIEIGATTVFGGLQVIARERGEELPGWSGEQGRESAHEHPGPALDAVGEMMPA